MMNDGEQPQAIPGSARTGDGRVITDLDLARVAERYLQDHPQAVFWITRRFGRRESWVAGSPNAAGLPLPSRERAECCRVYMVHTPDGGIPAGAVRDVLSAMLESRE